MNKNNKKVVLVGFVIICVYIDTYKLIPYSPQLAPRALGIHKSVTVNMCIGIHYVVIHM